jgi:hypothetical protein
MRIEFALDLKKLRHDTRRKRMAGIAKEPSLRRNLILAYQIESILSDGRAKDITEIAGWLTIGRTRLVQVANLLLLAPSIQEEIIFAHNAIIEAIPEYKTREILNEPRWDKQQLLWSSLLSKTSLHQKR